jgi:hypothetical protein
MKEEEGNEEEALKKRKNEAGKEEGRSKEKSVITLNSDLLKHGSWTAVQTAGAVVQYT